MKSIIRAMLALGLAATTFCAAAQDGYPDHQIQVIIPLAAASAVDAAARVLMPRVSNELKQSIYIENLPGSAGLIGTDRLVRSPADGYTIGGVNDSVLAMVPNLYKVTWNPLTDLMPISLVGTIEWGLVVKSDSPYHSVTDLIKAAKAHPGALNYGSGGSGSPQHLAMAMFDDRAGIKMTHVPYKGATQAAIGVAAGEVDTGFLGLATVLPLVSAGKLRLLAVSTHERLPYLPGVPTVNESGLPGYFFNSWFALIAPKGTPKQIVNRLYAAVAHALKDKDVRQELTEQGLTVRGTTPAEFQSELKKQYALYRGIIRAQHIQIQ